MSTTKRTTKRRSRPTWAKLRNLLLERREQLLAQIDGELADSREDPLGARYGDIADQASDTLYSELAHGFAEIASANLRMIDNALMKIDDKTYGCCEACGNPIPEARLRVLPFAELCVQCKRQEEEEADGPPASPYSTPLHPGKGVSGTRSRRVSPTRPRRSPRPRRA